MGVDIGWRERYYFSMCNFSSRCFRCRPLIAGGRSIVTRFMGCIGPASLGRAGPGAVVCGLLHRSQVLGPIIPSWTIRLTSCHDV